MAHINSPSQINKIMKDNGLNFHKGLGQNFLFDEHYLEMIVDAADITPQDVIIEIGPGLGVLTTRMAEKAKKVIAIEIDKNIAQVLSKITCAYDNIEIILSDVLKIDLNEITKKYDSVKIVANLPYYITTPIIMKILESTKGVKSVVVMVQKEVALRFTAQYNTKDYGAITLCVNYYTDSEIKFIVPPTAFVPPPKVESAVVRMDILPQKRVSVENEELFFKIIKCAFGQRRKTFVNAVSNGIPNITKDELIKVLKELNINENIRGEALDINIFSEICKKIEKNKGKQILV